MKCISFKATDSAIKIGCLYANNYKNVKSHFEILHNIDVNHPIYDNNNYYFLKDFMLNVKVEQKLLFLSAEQGTGKYAMNVYVAFESKMKHEVHKQFY